MQFTNRGDYDSPAIFVGLLFGLVQFGWCYGLEMRLGNWTIAGK